MRRRVGASREESRRAVTVEEPETELTTEVEVPLPPAEPADMVATAPAAQAGEGAEAHDSMMANSLRAFASHFWSHKAEKLWNSLPGQREYESLRCFFAERIETPETSVWRKRRKNYSSKRQKEKHGKNLVYSKCPEDVQKELDKTREKEWNKWKEFSAAIVIDKQQLEELVREGHQIVPTQWVEVDKNHAQRLLDPSIEPKYKSRLVVRGDLEQGDPRSDSPTASIEAQNIVFSFAASRRLKICSLDVTNAYFQGEEIDRILLLSQPKGGLPGLKPDEHMLARAPILVALMEAGDSGNVSGPILRIKVSRRTESAVRCTASRTPVGWYRCS